MCTDNYRAIGTDEEEARLAVLCVCSTAYVYIYTSFYPLPPYIPLTPIYTPGPKNTHHSPFSEETVLGTAPGPWSRDLTPQLGVMDSVFQS